MSDAVFTKAPLGRSRETRRHGEVLRAGKGAARRHARASIATRRRARPWRHCNDLGPPSPTTKRIHYKRSRRQGRDDKATCPWGSRDPSQRGHLTIENRETKKNEQTTDEANTLYEHESTGQDGSSIYLHEGDIDGRRLEPLVLFWGNGRRHWDLLHGVF